MTLETVFLDFGNTLVRESPSRFEIYAQSARSAGVEITSEEMHVLMIRAHTELPREVDGAWRYTDGWFRVYIERIFHDYLGIARGGLAELQERLFARFSDAHTFELFPGAHELLTDLKARGLGLGIISNWSTRLPKLVEGLGLGRWFDVVVCSAIERLEKPDPGIFRLALERASVSADRALHAGDHPDKDCRAARDAGLESVWVDHGGMGVAGAAPKDTPRVTSLSELCRHILGRLP